MSLRRHVTQHVGFMRLACGRHIMDIVHLANQAECRPEQWLSTGEAIPCGRITWAACGQHAGSAIQLAHELNRQPSAMR